MNRKSNMTPQKEYCNVLVLHCKAHVGFIPCMQHSSTYINQKGDIKIIE